MVRPGWLGLILILGLFTITTACLGGAPGETDQERTEQQQNTKDEENKLDVGQDDNRNNELDDKDDDDDNKQDHDKEND